MSRRRVSKRHAGPCVDTLAPQGWRMSDTLGRWPSLLPPTHSSLRTWVRLAGCSNCSSWRSTRVILCQDCLQGFFGSDIYWNCTSCAVLGGSRHSGMCVTSTTKPPSHWVWSLFRRAMQELTCAHANSLDHQRTFRRVESLVVFWYKYFYLLFLSIFFLRNCFNLPTENIYFLYKEAFKKSSNCIGK